MAKLTKTQQNLINELRHDLAVIRSYPDYETFYDNCGYNRDGNNQSQLTTGNRCGYNYDTAEKYKKTDPKRFEESKAWYNKVVAEGLMIVYAKTETVQRLADEGLVEIVEPAKWKGSAEIVKVIEAR